MLSRARSLQHQNCRFLCITSLDSQLRTFPSEVELSCQHSAQGVDKPPRRYSQPSLAPQFIRSRVQTSRKQRQCFSEVLSRSESSDLNSSNLYSPLNSHKCTEVSPITRALSKEAGWPADTEAASNDAHLSPEISMNISEKILSFENLTEPPDSKALVAFLNQVKHPAQVEWEKLWYHGITAAHKKIAHHFSNSEFTSSAPIGDQNISEPTLSISSLKKEEQALFREEERQSREAFAPKSEEDRLLRQSRAREATNEQEKTALLLGLPTFDEYIKEKYLRDKQEITDPLQPSKRQLKRAARFTQRKEKKQSVKVQGSSVSEIDLEKDCGLVKTVAETSSFDIHWSTRCGMTHPNSQATTSTSLPIGGAEHRPLVVGLTKPQSARTSSTMASSSDAAALNKEIEKNVKSNVAEAAPSEDNPITPAASKPKKEKAPKQPKPQKAAAPAAPTSPALIDLRVGHILRAITHPNADSLYVSTIAMGDPEGTEHTQVDEQTGKVVRTVCSGLNGLIPLEEMQDRKIVVVANLKPVNMRSIKSAAMVLAASPKQEEGADPHAPDRVVELVQPPETAEAGDKVYFEGWPYGEGKGPEKQLNPKKKQWEAIQPGFYTNDDLVVGFDAGQCDEVDSAEKGNLVVEGKGVCTVKTLKGAMVR